MLRRQSDSDGEPQDRTGLLIGLFVLFVIILIFFLVLATNFLRSQAEARSLADIGNGLATLTPDFGNELLFPTETETAIPTETETAIPTETETVMPTEIDTAAPLEVDTASPTPEAIIPVTGVDLQEEQAAAARQGIRVGVGILAVSLFVLGLLFRLKHK